MNKTLRVLSYNIHKGFNLGNFDFVLAEIRDRIREVDAELVFLQEVLGEHNEYKKSLEDYPVDSQFEFLAEGIWPHFTYGKNAVYEEGHHGNAILSKYPLVTERNLDLSTNLWERRGLLHTSLVLPNKQRIHLLNSHLNLTHRGRMTQVAKICDHVRLEIKESEAILFAGDFNDWQEKLSVEFKNELALDEVFQHLRGEHARSFPSFFPKLALDRIYFRGLKAIRAQELNGIPWSRLSDHLAIFAEFEIF